MLQYDCNHKAGIKERSVASIGSDPVEGDAKAFVSLLLCHRVGPFEQKTSLRTLRLCVSAFKTAFPSARSTCSTRLKNFRVFRVFRGSSITHKP